MAYEESLKSISLDVDATLGFYTGVSGLPGSTDPNYGKQYCFIKIVSAHKVGLATAAGDEVVGILQNKPQVPGQAGTVGIFGVSNVMAAGVLAAGVRIGPDAGGRAIVNATGRWLTLAAATTAGELVPALRV
jgi:hypothetical protein